MNAAEAPRSVHPLEGCAIGFSTALGEDSGHYGFTAEEMNRSVLRLSHTLLSAGARLVFGHDWRPNGIMAAIGQLAVRFDPFSSTAGARGGERPCLITSFVPWGRPTELPSELRNDLEMRHILRIEQIPLPPALLGPEQAAPPALLRAAGLTQMRRRLADESSARVCFGGKFQKFEGFFPGVVEEAWGTASKGRPVYISAMMGGAAGKLLQAAKTGDWSSFVQESAPGEGVEFTRSAAQAPSWDQIKTVLQWDKLRRNSGLSEEDWLRLTAAKDVDVVSAFVIKGLSRLSGMGSGR